MSSFDFNVLPAELFPYVFRKLPASELTRLVRSTRRLNRVSKRCRQLTKLSIPFISTHTESDEENSLRFCSYTGKCTNLRRDDTERLQDFSLFRIHAQEFSIMGAVTSEFLEKWIPVLKKLKITCDRLEIYPEVSLSCAGAEMKLLLQVVKPRQLYCIEPIQRASFPPNVFDRVGYIRITSNYSNEDLLAMKQPRLKMSSPNIDSLGINLFLKQWFADERRIEKATLSTTRPLSVDATIRGLPVSVLYTPFYHQDSLLKALDPNVNRESIFVLMKPSDVRNIFILKVDYNSITMERTSDPTNYLTSRLTCPEYELVTGRCKAGDFPMYFCFHHRSLASLLMSSYE